MTTADRIVIVGASLAGLRAAEALRELGHAGSITMIGAEAHRPYDRPPLSKRVLTGRVEPAATTLDAPDSLGVDWRLGSPATTLDLDGRTVGLAGGARVGFDRLVVTTGAHARSLPHLPAIAGVHQLRTVDDAAGLRAGLVAGGHLVVIGAGFIGLEVAASAIAAGVEVTVVELADLPLARIAAADIGAVVRDWHVEHGVDLRLGATVNGLEGDGQVTGVRLTGADGSEATIPADLVVVGVGAAPSTAWLDGSGVDLDDGLRTDASLRVLAGGAALPHVVAAGDVVRRDDPSSGRTMRVEHWSNAVAQAATAAATLMGRPAAAAHPVPYFWSDQFDRKIQMVGHAEAGDDALLVDGTTESRRFVLAYGRAGRLVAAIGFSRPGPVMALQRAIAEGAPFPPPA